MADDELKAGQLWWVRSEGTGPASLHLVTSVCANGDFDVTTWEVDDVSTLDYDERARRGSLRLHVADFIKCATPALTRRTKRKS